MNSWYTFEEVKRNSSNRLCANNQFIKSSKKTIDNVDIFIPFKNSDLIYITHSNTETVGT